VPRLLGAKSRGLNRTGHPLGWGLLTLGALDRGVLRVPFRAARLRRWGTSERFSAGFASAVSWVMWWCSANCWS